MTIYTSSGMSVLNLISNRTTFASVFLLFFSLNLFAQSNTQLGQDALTQPASIQYKIKQINVTNQGSYVMPWFNITNNGQNINNQIEWDWKYIYGSTTGLQMEGYFKSSVSLDNLDASVTGSGSGATVQDLSFQGFSLLVVASRYDLFTHHSGCSETLRLEGVLK